jgi:hypothetical protein
LFIHCYFLPNFCHHQIVVRITICCPECLHISIRIWSIWLRLWDVAKFTTLTPLSLVISCKLSLPNCQFKNVFSAYFSIEISQQNFHMVFREFIEYTFQFLTEAIFHIISFILCSGMNIQNNNMKPATSQYYVWHPIMNKLNPRNCWYDSLMYKKNPVPNSWLLFSFP